MCSDGAACARWHVASPPAQGGLASRLRRCGDILLASPAAYEELRAGGLLIDAPSESHLKKLRAEQSGRTGHDMTRYRSLRDHLGTLPAELREVRRVSMRAWSERPGQAVGRNSRWV